MPSCGKRPHVNHAGAERHLRQLKRQNSNYRGWIYVCPVCGYLHVGRKPKDARKDRRRDGQ